MFGTSVSETTLRPNPTTNRRSSASSSRSTPAPTARRAGKCSCTATAAAVGLYPIVTRSTAQPRYIRSTIIFSSCFLKWQSGLSLVSGGSGGASDALLDELIADRLAGIVVLAGKNDCKMETIAKLTAAGRHSKCPIQV